MTWIALFSQTGSELASICKEMGKYPDYIYVDGAEREVHPDLQGRVRFLTSDAINKLLTFYHEDIIVTLHGYLKIIPPESIVNKMYNGHPGDIIKYPELKGIDPQKKAIELGLPSTGVILHEVTEEVDGGKPLLFFYHSIYPNSTVDELIDELRNLSINMWRVFLRGKV